MPGSSGQSCSNYNINGCFRCSLCLSSSKAAHKITNVPILLFHQTEQQTESIAAGYHFEIVKNHSISPARRMPTTWDEMKMHRKMQWRKKPMVFWFNYFLVVPNCSSIGDRLCRWLRVLCDRNRHVASSQSIFLQSIAKIHDLSIKWPLIPYIKMPIKNYVSSRIGPIYCIQAIFCSDLIVIQMHSKLKIPKYHSFNNRMSVFSIFQIFAYS